MLGSGKELLENRHNGKGISALKAQLESIDVRWRVLVKRSENRQDSLENAFGNRFQEEVKRVTLWINQKSREAEKMEGTQQDPQAVKVYIQVSMNINRKSTVSCSNNCQVLIHGHYV